MKRHIARMHRGAKRNHETRTEDSLDQQDDKRPKVDENFGPALSFTQISDDDEELDKFDAVLLAKENDHNEAGLSFELSDETIARLGNDTNFDMQDEGNTKKDTNTATYSWWQNYGRYFNLSQR